MSRDADLVQALFEARIAALRARGAAVDDFVAERDRLALLGALSSVSEAEFWFDVLLCRVVGTVGNPVLVDVRTQDLVSAFRSAVALGDRERSRSAWEAISQVAGNETLTRALVPAAMASAATATSEVLVSAPVLVDIAGPISSGGGTLTSVPSVRKELDRGGRIVLVGAIAIIVISLVVGVVAVLLSAI